MKSKGGQVYPQHIVSVFADKYVEKRKECQEIKDLRCRWKQTHSPVSGQGMDCLGAEPREDSGLAKELLKGPGCHHVDFNRMGFGSHQIDNLGVWNCIEITYAG